MENPPPSYLDGVFPDGVADWTKFTAGTLTRLFHATATFARAWTPLERRWEAGGARDALANHTIDLAALEWKPGG